MKVKFTRTLVIVLVAVALAAFSPALSSTTPTRQCVANMRILEGAIEMYDMDATGAFSFQDGHPVKSYPDLVGKKYIRSWPECRSGGIYRIKASEPSVCEVTCSAHGTIADPIATERNLNNKEISMALAPVAGIVFLGAIPFLINLLKWKKRESDIKTLTKSFMFFHVVMLLVGISLTVIFSGLSLSIRGITRTSEVYYGQTGLFLTYAFSFPLGALLTDSFKPNFPPAI